MATCKYTGSLKERYDTIEIAIIINAGKLDAQCIKESIVKLVKQNMSVQRD